MEKEFRKLLVQTGEKLIVAIWEQKESQVLIFRRMD
jgi:hypothetical protein